MGPLPWSWPWAGAIPIFWASTLAATLAPVLAGLGWLGFRRVSAPPDDPAWEPPAARPAWKPSRPLALFMASRVLFLAGMLIVPTFLLFMVQDLLQAPRVRETAAWLVGLTLAGAAGFAWPAARLTRRMGEVPVLLGAGLALALAAAAFVLGGGRSWALGLASMIVYGAASGLVMTAGISLNMKLLPGSGAGRVMALVSAGTFLAQAVASLAGGLVLDRLNRISPNLGYRGLLGLVLLFLALGAVCLVAMQHRPRLGRIGPHLRKMALAGSKMCGKHPHGAHGVPKAVTGEGGLSRNPP